MIAPSDDSIILGRGGIVLKKYPPSKYYVYLLHFKQPYKHAKHYLGFTGCLPERLKSHRMGCSARLMEVIHAAGIDFELARLWHVETWEEGHELERRLKRRCGSVKFCPICQGREFDFETLLFTGKRDKSFYEHTGKRQPMN